MSTKVCIRIKVKRYFEVFDLLSDYCKKHKSRHTKKEILVRMLNNLRAICIGRQAWYGVTLVLARMLAVVPDTVELNRELTIATANLSKLN